jgi:hypothetical protein
MKKKAFRERKAEGPKYPRFGDLNSGALRKWGLAAVGGLLLGSAACTRTTSVPPATTTKTEQQIEKTAIVPRAPDAGESAAPYIGPPGEAPMDRAELEKANPPPEPVPAEAGKQKAKPARERAPGDRVRLRGRMPSPRRHADKQGDW